MFIKNCGYHLSQLLKAQLFLVKFDNKYQKYYRIITPSDRTICLESIKAYSTTTVHAGVVSLNEIKTLTACSSETMSPFSFSEEIQLLADSSIKLHSEIFFNPGTSDRLIFLSVNDYIKSAQPVFI